MAIEEAHYPLTEGQLYYFILLPTTHNQAAFWIVIPFSFVYMKTIHHFHAVTYSLSTHPLKRKKMLLQEAKKSWEVAFQAHGATV